MACSHRLAEQRFERTSAPACGPRLFDRLATFPGLRPDGDFSGTPPTNAEDCAARRKSSAPAQTLPR